MQPRIGENEHRFWARGPAEAENIQALYPPAFQRIDMTAPVDPAYYRYPVMVTPIADSGWSVIALVEPSVCPSVSVNRRWNAHDFCLVGHDVARGQSITCRAWLAYAKLRSLEDALAVYERLARSQGEQGR